MILTKIVLSTKKDSFICKTVITQFNLNGDKLRLRKIYYDFKLPIVIDTPMVIPLLEAGDLNQICFNYLTKLLIYRNERDKIDSQKQIFVSRSIYFSCNFLNIEYATIIIYFIYLIILLKRRKMFFEI